MQTQTIQYEILKSYGKISESGNKDKELNLISYNGFPGKYDLRGWFTDNEGKRLLGKGLTLTKQEIYTLRELLNSIDLEEQILDP